MTSANRTTRVYSENHILERWPSQSGHFSSLLSLFLSIILPNAAIIGASYQIWTILSRLIVRFALLSGLMNVLFDPFDHMQCRTPSDILAALPGNIRDFLIKMRFLDSVIAHSIEHLAPVSIAATRRIDANKLFTSNDGFANEMYKSPQEAFWAGSFGDEYSVRNNEIRIVASNTALFSRILARTGTVNSIMEFGANIGLNLIAINRLMPMAELSAVEINQKACNALEGLGFVKVYCGSMIDFEMDRPRDFVFSKGVLIHIDPELLSKAYEALYRTSKRYICVCEYYNPTPVDLKYRGHENKLFKRDFSGEMLEKYSDLRLVDYGFVYHRDPRFPQDDLSWFLMEKTGMAKSE